MCSCFNPCDLPWGNGGKFFLVRIWCFPRKHFSVLSATDEDVGRAIVATVAWGTARETLGRADEFAEMHPSDLSVARAEAARAEVARTRDVFNEALAAIGIGPFLADEVRVTDFLP
jgi:hypothetical protein